ncbi:MAG: permease, partial [Firmicutes bacterium HGW-Firmicutes-18]
VTLIYLVIFVLMPDKAAKAMGNSVYYLIEMVQVLPIIFLLTVVIEALVPKEMITRRLGAKSGFLGNILSLILGSISAGPIYAAFPISKMLLTKGASVSNVVIILSSWAVIKLPMLANEAKFLGVSFMGVRWVLTVIAILIMAWITGKLVDKKDMLIATVETVDNHIAINKDYCIGCGICVKMMPEVYEIIDQKAHVIEAGIKPGDDTMILKTAEKCPTHAIAVKRKGGAVA